MHSHIHISKCLSKARRGPQVASSMVLYLILINQPLTEPKAHFLLGRLAVSSLDPLPFPLSARDTSMPGHAHAFIFSQAGRTELSLHSTPGDDGLSSLNSKFTVLVWLAARNGSRTCLSLPNTRCWGWSGTPVLLLSQNLHLLSHLLSCFLLTNTSLKSNDIWVQR